MFGNEFVYLHPNDHIFLPTQKRKVKDLFRRKYVGDGKLSYTDVSRYTITGLPQGLTFRSPSRYGRKQLEQILEKEATLVIKDSANVSQKIRWEGYGK